MLHHPHLRDQPRLGHRGVQLVAAAAQKPDLSLLSPIALTLLGRVLTFGASKYSPNNWRKGIDQSRLVAALLRHVFAHMAGIEEDEETHLPHIAHAMCCCMFILEQMYSLDSERSINTLAEYTDEDKAVLETLLSSQAL